LLQNSTATVQGLVLMLLSMLCYSGGVIYYAETKWRLSSIVINGWQVFIGGIMLLPFAFFMHHPNAINHFDAKFWASEGWLIVPVSIISVQLWLYLLKVDAVRASLWLFLCPVFGFVYAAVLLNEPITLYTIIGTLFVIAGLYLGQRKRQAGTGK
jgi:probable blue pigment (indigoidine) exporter